jgi:hypothetical protein
MCLSLYNYLTSIGSPGIVTTNSAPLPSSETSSIEPFCLSTNAFTIDNPKPEECSLLVGLALSF